MSNVIEILRRLQCSDAACGDLRIAMAAKLAIHEIERLTAERDEARRAIGDSLQTLIHLRQEQNALRAERDEARRRICEVAVHLGDVYRRVNGLNVRLATGREVADMMGWDCYRETTDER